MTLEQALHYIHAVCWKGSIPGLERIEALLDKMGHKRQGLDLRDAGIDLSGRGL